MPDPAMKTNTGSVAPPILVLAGVIAATHVGKVPAALGALRESFGLSLVNASLLVSVLQVSGALLGLFGGLIAARLGHRRAMISGLLLLGLASLAGSRASSSGGLLATRVVESIGFLMAVLPAPALIARAAAGRAAVTWLGAWGAYMPTGFALSLLLTPLVVAGAGWRAAWLAGGLGALAAAFAVYRVVPADASVVAGARPGAREAGRQAARTLGDAGPWLLAAIFGIYAAQYLSVFAFLPTIYAQAGIAPADVAVLTALAAGINAAGNIAAGFLLRRGVPAPLTIAVASIAMGAGAWVAIGTELPFAARYAAVAVQSLVAGLIPGTLFACVPRYAPGREAIGTTVGLVQQGSGLGQLLLPPVIATLASSSGGWPRAALGLVVLATVNVGLAFAVARHEWRRARASRRDEPPPAGSVE